MLKVSCRLESPTNLHVSLRWTSYVRPSKHVPRHIFDFAMTAHMDKPWVKPRTIESHYVSEPENIELVAWASLQACLFHYSRSYCDVVLKKFASSLNGSFPDSVGTSNAHRCLATFQVPCWLKSLALGNLSCSLLSQQRESKSVSEYIFVYVVSNPHQRDVTELWKPDSWASLCFRIGLRQKSPKERIIGETTK